MPTLVESADEIRPGDFFEDCAYHPCLCVSSGAAEVHGISMVDGSFPRNCGVPQCGVRKLTVEEAITWRLYGPPDLPAEIEMTDEQKYWLKDWDYACRLWPAHPPILHLEPSRVPVQFRQWIPLAERWGISDDRIRDQRVLKATPEELRELLTFGAAYEAVLTEWLAGPAAGTDSFFEEFAAFTYLGMACELAKVEAENLARKIRAEKI